ncbi:MAG: PaaI family thioesterase [Desulfomonilaceae bacterium]|nr:PaaI family thioesterase [Desulfomonilaceae bacterium]
MGRINPQYAEEVKRVVNQCPYFRLLSMELREFDVGTSLVEIDLQEKHMQPFGQVHGGVFATIIDATTFWAVFAEIDEQSGMTSVDLKLNYLAPAAAPGQLIARGRRIRIGKTLGLGEAEVMDGEGRMLAHGTSTLMVMNGWSIAQEGALPPKFIE